MTRTVRTRFAPSPTGALHLGNVRIAVFNWLFTRHHGGRFVLRIEDTDVARGEEGSEERIMEDLRWLGLFWDEGPDVGGEAGPYRQSERLDRYGTAARRLVGSGRAYPCYCTEEELEVDRDSVGEGRDVLRYSGRCRALTEDERSAHEAAGRTPVIRFAAPRTGEVTVEDEIRGSISFPASDMTDFIILRGDGRPTYNFGVVVDDVEMKISHVLRGAGHLSNTPKQALLFRALDEPEPLFAHLPTVLAPDGGKLSKREGAVAVSSFRDEGLHPDAVVNYLSLLGWSSPDEREVLSRDELVENVTLERLGASDTAYDPEKLRWLSGQHIARMDAEGLVDASRPFLGAEWAELSDPELRRAAEVLRTRLQTFRDFGDHLHLLYPEAAVLEAAQSDLEPTEDTGRVLDRILLALKEVEPWEPDPIMEAVRTAGSEAGVRGRRLFHPIRIALTGSESGPDLGGVAWAIGRNESLRRIGASRRKVQV